jgi:hypothetical protein
VCITRSIVPDKAIRPGSIVRKTIRTAAIATIKTLDGDGNENRFGRLTEIEPVSQPERIAAMSRKHPA